MWSTQQLQQYYCHLLKQRPCIRHSIHIPSAGAGNTVQLLCKAAHIVVEERKRYQVNAGQCGGVVQGICENPSVVGTPASRGTPSVVLSDGHLYLSTIPTSRPENNK